MNYRTCEILFHCPKKLFGLKTIEGLILTSIVNFFKYLSRDKNDNLIENIDKVLNAPNLSTKSWQALCLRDEKTIELKILTMHLMPLAKYRK